MIESPAMVKPYSAGVARRLAILQELVRRERAGLPAPSAQALAETLGWPRATVTWHVRNLRKLGWVESTVGRRARVTLTDSGRNASASR